MVFRIFVVLAVAASAAAFVPPALRVVHAPVSRVIDCFAGTNNDGDMIAIGDDRPGDGLDLGRYCAVATLGSLLSFTNPIATVDTFSSKCA